MNNENIKEVITGLVGTSLSAVGTATQTQQVLQIISLIITIIGGIISFIVVPLLSWWKKSKQDGTIDADELKEGAKIIAEGSEKIKDEIEKSKEK